MGYTWKQFNDAVKVLLPLDAQRLGASDFITQHIRQAVIDCQDVIKRYRTGQQNVYGHDEVIPWRACSKVTVPVEAQIRDCFLIRWKEGDEPLTGLTTAQAADTSARPQLVAQDTLFTEELAIGDVIMLETDIDAYRTKQYATVTEIVSDDTLMLDKGLGNLGVQEQIFKLSVQRHPCVHVGWECREKLFVGGYHDFIDNNAQITLSPDGILYVYPGLVSADADSWKYLLEVNWDGKKIEFEDADVTPFDEEMTKAVANCVKAECSRHFDKDMTAYKSFMDSYLLDRQKLYLGARDRAMFAK